MKAPAIFTLGVLLIFTNCSRDKSPEPAHELDIQSSLIHDDIERTYLIHFPPTYYENKTKLPMLIALHGGGGSALNFQNQSGLDAKADAENFIIVYPDGLENPGAMKTRTRNAGKCCGPNASILHTDDVGFISSLIDGMIKEYKVDPKSVYATGHSNGAMLCYRLANELSEKIAAIAPNAGNFQFSGSYHPSRNVPVIHINSKLDQNVKYEGGMSTGPGGQYNPPVDSCLNVIASLAECSQSKVLVSTFPLYSIYKWTSCNPQTFEVDLYLTEDGGHSWPGGNKGHADADEPSKAFNNNDIIWEFLKKYSLP
jgi:polyhydroxybutyrate depolymerase